MVLFGKKTVKDIKIDKFVETKLLLTKKVLKNNKTLLSLVTIYGLYYMLKSKNLI